MTLSTTKVSTQSTTTAISVDSSVSTDKATTKKPKETTTLDEDEYNYEYDPYEYEDDNDNTKNDLVELISQNADDSVAVSGIKDDSDNGNKATDDEDYYNYDYDPYAYDYEDEDEGMDKRLEFFQKNHFGNYNTCQLYVRINKKYYTIFTETLGRSPKKLSNTLRNEDQNSDVAEIDAKEYADLVDSYTENDLEELFLAYGVDLANYDYAEALKRLRKKRKIAQKTGFKKMSHIIIQHT